MTATTSRRARAPKSANNTANNSARAAASGQTTAAKLPEPDTPAPGDNTSGFARATTPPQSDVRLIGAPRSDPPYVEDFPPFQRIAALSEDAFDDQLPLSVERRRRTVPSGHPTPANERGEPSTRPGDQPQDRPNPRKFAGSVAVAVLEVMTGRRPIQQLRNFVSETVYAQIMTQLRTPTEAMCRAIGRPGTNRREPRRGTHSPRLRTVHVTEPENGVAEAAVTVQRGERVVAAALRLEIVDSRWRCTSLTVL